MKEEIENRIKKLKEELEDGGTEHHGAIWAKIDFLEKLYEALYINTY
jgi:hypothetical protein